MANILGIGLSGLLAHQTALQTTSQNITNANTPGYSRQQTQFETAPTLPTGAGYQGSGVLVSDIQRLNDEFVNAQLRADTTLFSGQDTLLKELSTLNNVLGGESTGLNTALNNFFAALQGAADRPTSIPERQLVLARAEALVQRFGALEGRLQQQKATVNQQIAQGVGQVNELIKGIAELNVAINSSPGVSQGRNPNELLDQRDELLRKLSEQMQIQVVPNGNQINVLAANGQTLVLGGDVRTLGVSNSPADPSRQQIVLSGTPPEDITGTLSGGSLGALLHFRDKVLEPTFSGLGRVALAISDEVNDVHQRGMDLEGQLGGLFFKDINTRESMLARAIPNQNNASPRDRVVSVEITDTSKLPAGDFVVEFIGPDNTRYAVRRAEDGKVLREGALNGLYPTEIPMDGFSITLESGSFQRGDSFLIRPTANAASQMKLALERPEQIALGQPLRAESELGNEGTGAITQGTILDFENPLTRQMLSKFGTDGAAPPPYVVRFVTEDTYDVLQRDPADPSRLIPLDPPLTNQKYVPGSINKLFPAEAGQTLVRMGGDALATIGTAGDNGYLAQTLEFSFRDPATGQLTNQTVNLGPDGLSARDMATALNTVSGVSANAYTTLGLRFGTPPVTPVDFSVTVGGTTLTLTNVQPDAMRPENLADEINANPDFKDLGVVASIDGNQLVIRSIHGDDISVGFPATGGGTFFLNKDPYGNGTGVIDQPVVAGTTYVVGGVVDISLAEGALVRPQDMDLGGTGELFALNPTAQLTYRGIQFDISGSPAGGDTFGIHFNSAGVSDNRNGLNLAGLANSLTLQGGLSFNGAYNDLVGNVGTLTNQARMDQEAGQVLLSQSETQWQQKSGVNLDEEAGRLIQYQAAYNASAQVVSIARDLFDTLINTFR